MLRPHGKSQTVNLGHHVSFVYRLLIKRAGEIDEKLRGSGVDGLPLLYALTKERPGMKKYNHPSVRQVPGMCD